jgi:hypothetical protein
MSNRNDNLRAIMKEHHLKVKDVAALLGREEITVRIWLCEGARTTREIPAEQLERLELKLAAKQK